MAAIFISVGLVIAEKVSAKKQARKDKKRARDDQRFQELQADTQQRLARTQSGNVIAAVPDDRDSEDSPRNGNRDAPPPLYEDVVAGQDARGGRV